MGLLSPAAKAALQTGPIYVGAMVSLDFSFGVERYWSGVHELTYQGEIYLPVGDAGRISPMESSAALRANGLQLSLTIPHVDGKPLPKFQNVRPEQYKNRRAVVTIGFFDETFTNVIYALERRYFMDVLTYQVSLREATTVTIAVESELMRGGKRSTKRLTDEQQRDDFPGDLAMQFLSYLESGVEARWGTEGAFFKQ